MGLFTNYAEIGQRALTKWRALATDIFVQDSWRPTSNLTVEGGVRYGPVAAVLLADQQHRHVRPGVLQHQPTRR